MPFNGIQGIGENFNGIQGINSLELALDFAPYQLRITQTKKERWAVIEDNSA